MKKIFNKIMKPVKYDCSTKVKYAGGELDIQQGTQIDLHIQGDNFIIRADSLTYKISINKITSLRLVEEKNQVKEAKSPIWRAVIGGVLFCWFYPPIGFLAGVVVGAISGIGHNNRIYTNHVLRIIFTDKELNNRELTFDQPYMDFDFDYELRNFIKELSVRLPEGATTPPTKDKIIEL